LGVGIFSEEFFVDGARFYGFFWGAVGSFFCLMETNKAIAVDNHFAAKVFF
jgi:hypothetical protein